MAAKLESVSAENIKIKSDLKLRESDMRTYHSKYHQCRTEILVVREQLKKTQDELQRQRDFKQSPINSGSGSPNDLEEIIQYLAIEGTPNQNSAPQNEPVEPEQSASGLLSTPIEDQVDDFWKDFWLPNENPNRLYEEPLAVEMSSDSDENGNSVFQIDQYQTENSKESEDPSDLTAKAHKPTKRRLFDENENCTPKKSIRLVFKSI